MKYFARILTAVVAVAFTVGPVSAATAPSVPASTVAQTGSSASATTGSLTGTVQDETGAPVANADVNLSGPASYTTHTDASGGFTIGSITPGLYHINAHKPGYSSANDDVTVIAGIPQTLQVRIQKATLTSLTTIATVRSVGRGTFNTTPASVDTVSAQVFQDQSSPQVGQILNEIPGVENSLPQSSANGASPGAITFANVRGGLSYETATLIDGHPLAVGDYGDYVTTFLNSFMFQDVEVIKGPGAMADQTNYAINGTVNFRTKDPTLTATPYYTFGIDNHGGSYFNFGLSDTVMHGRLGFVADFANIDTLSAIHGYEAALDPSEDEPVLDSPNGQPYSDIGYPPDTRGGPMPGTSTQYKNQYGLIACCLPVFAELYGNSELFKLRYKLSNATNATVSYFGSQSTSDQNANTSSITYGEFNPTIGALPGQVYTGPYALGKPVQIANNVYPMTNEETNNEPILQAEMSTTLNNDTILGRFYHANIQRLGSEGGNNPTIPQTGMFTLNGIDNNASSVNPTDPGAGVFNGETVPLSFYSYYHENEIDALNGYSFRYDHPVANNTFTFAYTGTHTTSVDYTNEANYVNGGAYSAANPPYTAGTNTYCDNGLMTCDGSIPPGSGTFYQTITGRATLEINPKLTGTIALYQNLYQSTFLSACKGTPAAGTTPALPGPTCDYNDNGSAVNGPVFTTTNTGHFDERAALEFRPQNDTAIRASLGSSIAPPYLELLSSGNAAPSCSVATGECIQDINNPNIRPETAFGYDFGADHRFKDHLTVLSGDVYLTNLSNQFVEKYVYASSTACSVTVCPGGESLYYESNVNLNRSRYEGIELRLHKTPPVGLGYNLTGSVMRAYVYDLPADFYCAHGGTSCSNPALLGIVPDSNFTGGSPNYACSTSYGCSAENTGEGGISNQNVPYLQAYAELNYRMKNGALALVGYTIMGKNNYLNEPPFGVTSATIRYPINSSVSVQVSGYNIFNVYPGLFPITAQGVAVPLANGTLGATNAGQLGPATYRFSLTKTIAGL